ARASPSIAFAALASRALVKPATAETTITGRTARCDLTIAATLRNASASSTDVPPNFMMVGLVDINNDLLCIAKVELLVLEHLNPVGDEMFIVDTRLLTFTAP